MNRDQILVHQISKACLAGYKQGLEGTHQDVPPMIDHVVDDNYRLAFQDGMKEARARVEAGSAHPSELAAAKSDHAASWKEGAECALDQVTRYLPREEAEALAEFNAIEHRIHAGMAYCDGYDAVMEAAEGLARPLKEAQREFMDILRIAHEGHDHLDAAGVPACPPDGEVEERSLIALVRRLERLPKITAPFTPAPASPTS